MSFTVTVVEGDDFKIRFGMRVGQAFDLIRQSYPEIRGRFCVIASENGIETGRDDLGPLDSFPLNDIDKRVVFLAPKRAPLEPGRYIRFHALLKSVSSTAATNNF